ncbi:hypothetical protein [Caudoviricetes sp.]|nr:hypothetical protein [Caudoviricetes sp.]
MIAAGNSAALVIATQTKFKNEAQFCQAVLNEIFALRAAIH